MHVQHAGDHGLHGLALVRIHVRHRLELQLQALVGRALGIF
jgi:hypothetical protein